MSRRMEALKHGRSRARGQESLPSVLQRKRPMRCGRLPAQSHRAGREACRAELYRRSAEHACVCEIQSARLKRDESVAARSARPADRKDKPEVEQVSYCAFL